MNYEVVELEEKTVAGLTARTRNDAPDMQQVIGNLWYQFYQGGIYPQIPDKKNEKAIGMYSEYATDVNGEYSVSVVCEVDKNAKVPENVVKKIIPAGKYAKFEIHGHMQKAVADFWEELWKMDLKRSYTCDFEEYQDCDMENATIFIYIALA